jgi:HSP20 family protein
MNGTKNHRTRRKQLYYTIFGDKIDMTPSRSPTEEINHEQEGFPIELQGASILKSSAIPSEGLTGSKTINVDVFEQNDEFVVIVDLPGISKDEINLQLTADGLQIEDSSDEREEETEENSSKTFFIRECPQSISRKIYLPHVIDRDESSVKSVDFDNGRLTIVLRKSISNQENSNIGL